MKHYDRTARRLEALPHDYTQAMASSAESMPRINLLARPLLLGLTYRALAAEADATQAPLTQRRIEHAQARVTTLLQRASELRADIGVARERAEATRKHATRSELDLRLFMERYEPPKRGLLQRLTRDQRAAEAQRAELEAIAAADAAEAEAASARRTAVQQELTRIEAQLEAARAERLEHAALLGEQLAAHVLGLLAAGQGEVARDALELARTEIRGDVLVGTLLVLAELFDAPTPQDGLGAARKMLSQLEALFTQASDSSARVVALLLALVEGRRLGIREVGVLRQGSFQHLGHWRLYQLVIALSGGDPAADEQAGPWLGTLLLCREAALTQPVEDEPQSPAPRAADIAAAFESEDTVRMLVAAAILLQRERLELLWRALAYKLGVPDAPALDEAWQYPRLRMATEFTLSEHPRELSALVGPLLQRLDTPVAAWPNVLRAPVAAALACLTLLGLFMSSTDSGPDDIEAVAAPHWLYEQWLAESYGWPKTDLYWWMLAGLKGDPALLRNIGAQAGELFTISHTAELG